MNKQPIKKTCRVCGREHYENRACIKKETNNNILIKEKKIYK